MAMFPGGIEILIVIAYIALAIFIICVLIRLYNTLYYARKAYKRYLNRTTDQKQSDNSENASTENDASKSKP